MYINGQDISRNVRTTTRCARVELSVGFSSCLGSCKSTPTSQIPPHVSASMPPFAVSSATRKCDKTTQISLNCKGALEKRIIARSHARAQSTVPLAPALLRMQYWGPISRTPKRLLTWWMPRQGYLASGIRSPQHPPASAGVRRFRPSPDPRSCCETTHSILGVPWGNTPLWSQALENSGEQSWSRCLVCFDDLEHDRAFSQARSAPSASPWRLGGQQTGRCIDTTFVWSLQACSRLSLHMEESVPLLTRNVEPKTVSRLKEML